MAGVASLRAAGHQVVGVSGGKSDAPWVEALGDQKLIDRLRGRDSEERLGRLAARSRADLYLPTHPTTTGAATHAAELTGSPVLVSPRWPRPTSHDLIELAPSQPELAVPSTGLKPRLHTGDLTPEGLTELKKVVIIYRRSERTPGRYLQAAMERQGIDVIHSETIDWSAVERTTDAVVVVESPLPPMAVSGTNPGIPIVYWVHHGEHHLEANVRLQRHYGAHAVALAHSWHLAFRFHGLVERLPFAVAPELFPADFKAHVERRWDVGFVGSPSDGDRYSRREELLERARGQLGPTRVESRSDISPEEMAKLYLDSRIVIDDGAGRHLPVTMRVFEALGAGALLVTNPGPGLSQLMDEGAHYVADGDADDIATLASSSETVARAGHEAAWQNHTYDRRVEDVSAIVTRVRDEDVPPPTSVRPSPGVARLVGLYPDAQRLLDLGVGIGGDLPDREVWDFSRAADRAEPGTFHVALISGGSKDERARAIASARLAVVAPDHESDRLETEILRVHQNARRHDFEEGTVFSFGNSGYRVGPEPAST